MEKNNDKLLKFLFPNGVPEYIKNNTELDTYLEKLGNYKVDDLKKEQNRLEEENKSITEQTQELAISNYKTFIETSESSRSIFLEFTNAENHVESLIKTLPNFIDKYNQFQETAKEISIKKRLNSITLKRNEELLEILELPELMKTCIRDGMYEEALEIASYVQKLGQKHNDIQILNSIVTSVESLWYMLLLQLLAQLKSDLQLPKCLQIVGYLKRMQAFGPEEIKLKFLQARNTWLTSVLQSIPNDEPQQHLMKTIELTRIHLFNIITQYKAIFSDESISTKSDTFVCSDGKLLYSWLHLKIQEFLTTLERDLKMGVNSMDTLLGHCMYFGLSFSRVGADFRAQMAPIFTKIIQNNFKNKIIETNNQFESDLEKYTLINKVNTGLNRKKVEIEDQESYSPPETLLDYPPLATLCNGYLTAMNELILCAPISLVPGVMEIMQTSLENVSKNILIFYKREQQAFTGSERDNFVKFCSCFAYDFIPFIQKCLSAIFPPSNLCSYLGISLTTLYDEEILFFKQKTILEPLKHLLPDKIEAVLMQTQKMHKLDDKIKENIG